MVSGSIMQRLAAGLEQTGAADLRVRGAWANRCRQTQRLTEMTAVSPTLMIPVIGSKRIAVAEQIYEAGPGDFLVLPAGARFDVENIPNRSRGYYLGGALVFDAETVGLFRKFYGGGLDDWRLTPQWRAKGTDELFSAIAEWLIHNQSYPADPTHTRHRLIELLLILARQGVAGNLLFLQQASLRDRTKSLLALDPARDWRIGDVTRRLALGESTLRRQLRAEGVRFRDLLEEARLDRGVELVMATDMPIGQIAFDCGYKSQSRFSERFRLRFSLSPSELRATQKHPTSGVIRLHRPRASS